MWFYNTLPTALESWRNKQKKKPIAIPIDTPFHFNYNLIITTPKMSSRYTPKMDNALNRDNADEARCLMRGWPCILKEHSVQVVALYVKHF